MGYDTDLANRLRRAGLAVVEIGGWQGRGGSNFDPRGCILHHTAGPKRGDVPSLGVCVHGRGGANPVPGPLCNLLIGRDLVVRVIAAGKANHAGEGGYRGMTSSRDCYGIEVENTGYGTGPNAEPWTEAMLDFVARVTAALPVQVDLVCQHKEWAPKRKIDMHTVTGGEMRRRVLDIRNGASVPTPAPTPAPPIHIPEGDDDMAILVRVANANRDDKFKAGDIFMLSASHYAYCNPDDVVVFGEMAGIEGNDRTVHQIDAPKMRSIMRTRIDVAELNAAARATKV